MVEPKADAQKKQSEAYFKILTGDSILYSLFAAVNERGASSKTFTPSFHKEHLMDRDYGTLPYIVLSGRKAQITHPSGKGAGSLSSLVYGLGTSQFAYIDDTADNVSFEDR